MRCASCNWLVCQWMLTHRSRRPRSGAGQGGYDFNMPFNVVGADPHTGDLPARHGFAELLMPNVMLSGMKRAEEGDGLVIRLYETDGKATTAQMRLDAALCPAGAQAMQVDLAEQPAAGNTARFEQGVLRVDILPYGLATMLLA